MQIQPSGPCLMRASPVLKSFEKQQGGVFVSRKKWGRCKHTNSQHPLRGSGSPEGLRELYVPFNDVADVSSLKWLEHLEAGVQGPGWTDFCPPVVSVFFPGCWFSVGSLLEVLGMNGGRGSPSLVQFGVISFPVPAFSHVPWFALPMATLGVGP